MSKILYDRFFLEQYEEQTGWCGWGWPRPDPVEIKIHTFGCITHVIYPQPPKEDL